MDYVFAVVCAVVIVFLGGERGTMRYCKKHIKIETKPFTVEVMKERLYVQQEGGNSPEIWTCQFIQFIEWSICLRIIPVIECDAVVTVTGPEKTGLIYM